MVQIDLSSPEERANRIQHIRKQILGISRAKACENSDKVNPSSLKAWELVIGGGLTKPGAKKLVDLFRTLNVYCTEEWLLHGIGEKPMSGLNGQYIDKTLEVEKKQIASEILLFRSQQNSVDTRVNDTSMVPKFYPGYYVAGIIEDNIEKAINKACIIEDIHGQLFIRILKYGNEEGRFTLSHINKESSDYSDIVNVPINFVAPIVWIRIPSDLS